MSKVDPQDFMGKRVFVQTNKKNFVGTLKAIREYSIEIKDYFEVHQHTDEKILARGDYGSYSHIIMHSGGSRELLSIELNTLAGDPMGDDDVDVDHVADITPPAWMQTFAQDPGDEDDSKSIRERLIKDDMEREDTDGIPGRIVESTNYDSVIDTGIGLCD